MIVPILRPFPWTQDSLPWGRGMLGGFPPVQCLILGFVPFQLRFPK
jgi:hypothetical protein